MHHIRKAVGLHVNMEIIQNCSGFPHSLYKPAGAISFDKTRHLASKFMLICISFRDSDTRELISRKQIAIQKCYTSGNPPKNVVFKQT